MLSKLDKKAEALGDEDAVQLGKNWLGAHRLGVYLDEDGSQVPILCEWIKYGIHLVNQDQGELFARVKNIAKLFQMNDFPHGFRVLTCV